MKTFISIDWDYFIAATDMERAMLFPDGGNENIPSYVLTLVWAARYATSTMASEHNQGRRIEDIGACEKEIDLLQNYLIQKNLNCDIRTEESHKAAYDIFSGLLADGEQCNIINIDYHHDLYENTLGYVDCGNWLNEMLRTDRVNKLYWVCRTDSEELPEQYQACGKVEQTLDLQKVLNSVDSIDGVFICKSGVWSPPHLDTTLNEFISELGKEYTIRGTRFLNRYTQEFKDTVENQLQIQREITASFMNDHTK